MSTLASGYHPELVALDERMVRLGRPPAPVVSWLSGGLKGDIRERHKAWRQQVARWERANPDAARQWHELDAEYTTAEYLYERLERLGCPKECIEVVRKPRDTVAIECARDWFNSGDWCLVLFGGYGVGKTSAAAWIAHQMLTRNFSARWVRAPAASRNTVFGAEAAVQAEQARKAGVLIIDDIGADFENAGWKSWLEDVLDSRWGNNKRTVITVNTLTMDEFSARMGARLGDRLRTGRVYDCGQGSMR
jgi:chromosomal replication initiation ATPase DnaA